MTKINITMTKKLLSIAIAMTLSGQCFADDVPTLKISKASGSDNIALAELLSIKYSESNMIVNMKDGTTQTIALDDIVIMEITDAPTAINSIFPNSNSNASYTLTDISGKVIAKGEVKNGIELPKQKGIYVITVGEKTKKILVK